MAPKSVSKAVKLASALSAEYDEPSFEVVSADASYTAPLEASKVRKGSYLMIEGHPCKCVEMSTSKGGKHGHAKALFEGIDIFTGKKLEWQCQTSHNLDVPFVKKTELQVMDVNKLGGEVSLLQEDGTTKDDLNLPTFGLTGEPTPEDLKISKELLVAMDGGLSVTAIVLAACGIEKIIGVKAQACK
mmetsp:Transcript_22126/g.50637  ORF Transcript_22126/g.50637 Transcript_22126/m.50637 type:complete len:187 (-) Transcript_22126:80-640(-)